MQIKCKSCSRDIAASDVNIDQLVAKCSYCSAVFDFSDQLERSATATPRAEVQLPPGISVSQERGELLIRHRWFKPLFIFLAFFALVWDCFMVGWFYAALTDGIYIMAAFGIIHAGVGVGLTYYVIAGFFNTTTITVSRREIDVRHRPLFFPGTTLNPALLEQLYCKEKVHHNRRSTNYTYELHALAQDGTHKKLVGGLDEADQVLFLEQQIEAYLNIQDRPTQARGEVT